MCYAVGLSVAYYIVADSSDILKADVSNIRFSGDSWVWVIFCHDSHVVIIQKSRGGYGHGCTLYSEICYTNAAITQLGFLSTKMQTNR